MKIGAGAVVSGQKIWREVGVGIIILVRGKEEGGKDRGRGGPRRL